MAVRNPFKATNGGCFALDLYFQSLKNAYFVFIFVIFCYICFLFVAYITILLVFQTIRHSHYYEQIVM
jgi:hypothetical protein